MGRPISSPTMWLGSCWSREPQLGTYFLSTWSPTFHQVHPGDPKAGELDAKKVSRNVQCLWRPRLTIVHHGFYFIIFTKGTIKLYHKGVWATTQGSQIQFFFSTAPNKQDGPHHILFPWLGSDFSWSFPGSVVTIRSGACFPWCISPRVFIYVLRGLV